MVFATAILIATSIKHAPDPVDPRLFVKQRLVKARIAEPSTKERSELLQKSGLANRVVLHVSPSLGAAMLADSFDRLYLEALGDVDAGSNTILLTPIKAGDSYLRVETLGQATFGNSFLLTYYVEPFTASDITITVYTKTVNLVTNVHVTQPVAIPVVAPGNTVQIFMTYMSSSGGLQPLQIDSVKVENLGS